MTRRGPPWPAFGSRFRPQAVLTLSEVHISLSKRKRTQVGECCGGRTLWALNEAHLTLLEDYVAARLRERGQAEGMTLVARLPAWLKSAKNRGEVLRVITRLRDRGRGPSPSKTVARR
jgi:hypothetical protein